jgi:gliding motility-associated protein GldL
MTKAKKTPKAKTQEKGSFFESNFFKVFVGRLYGLGASVVILGALFKIMHWPMAGLMLTLGLSTEALIFAISAFEPAKHEIDWTRVYPELAADHGEESANYKKSISNEIDKMLEEAKIESHLVNSLGEGMRKLSDTVKNMNDISGASVATNEYTNSVKSATENINKASDSYGKSAEAMAHLGNATESSRNFSEQIRFASDNLTTLNSAYQKKLDETNKHVDALTKFSGNFSEAMSQLTAVSTSSKSYFDQIKTAAENLGNLNSVYQMELSTSGKYQENLKKYNDSLSLAINNLTEAGSITDQLKNEFGKLNQNLSNLNKVYGNMLSAMSPRV